MSRKIYPQEMKHAPDPETYFQDPGERHEKGSGMDIIAAERDAMADKTARLRAAREARAQPSG